MRTHLLSARSRVARLLTPAFLLLITLTAVAQERDRARIPDRYKWNLADIYATDAAWRAAKERLAGQLPELRQFEGRLGSSAATLADALEKDAALGKELSRLAVYASMSADEDTRNATHQGMRQEMSQLSSTFGSTVSYMRPEILKAGKPKIDDFIRSERRLASFRFDLDEMFRRAAHTLSDAEERILASMGPVSGASSSTYTILTNADFPYPTVTLSDGKAVKLDQAAYNLYRSSPNRADREKVMSAFFQSLGSFSRTFGATMNGQVQRLMFSARTRKYGSALEASLDGPNIPISVYTRLIEGMNKNLPSFHRYLALRKRMMGVDQLHYYDLYAPLVATVDTTYTPEEAQKLVRAGVATLGPEYLATIDRAFTERWIDYFPTTGKVTGAYSNGGAYDVHPYMLLNFNGQYNDVSTLAHELGHTIHSAFSNRTQPYPLAGYPIFLAEVASTFNESLLIDYMLANIKDDDTRLSLLGSYLENIKGTVFRQTQFAEFELRMHEMAWKGQPITGDALAKLYLDITKRYYGHDQGVAIVDDYVAHEWSFIPHFYRDFYVYQYATSFTASEALAAKVKAGDADAKRRYLAFLSAGGSKYPIDLLKDAGVDMTTDEPLDLTMTSMNRVMDEMARILARRAQPARR